MVDWLEVIIPTVSKIRRKEIQKRKGSLTVKRCNSRNTGSSRSPFVPFRETFLEQMYVQIKLEMQPGCLFITVQQGYVIWNMELFLTAVSGTFALRIYHLLIPDDFRTTIYLLSVNPWPSPLSLVSW